LNYQEDTLSLPPHQGRGENFLIGKSGLVVALKFVESQKRFMQRSHLRNGDNIGTRAIREF
jgi:hypothetical protein